MGGADAAAVEVDEVNPGGEGHCVVRVRPAIDEVVDSVHDLPIGRQLGQILEVGVLWARVLAVRGFPAFAEQAAGQFVRWEKPYGWTRRGFGRVSEKESSLTTVLAGMLPVPDSWSGFAERYLAVLDQPDAATSGRRGSSWRTSDSIRADRAQAMARWHLLLLDRFAGTEEESLLDRIAGSAGLGGPEMTFFRARLAERRGDLAAARGLALQALQTLPGHDGFLRFARDIGAELPPRGRQILDERTRALS